MSLSTTGGPGSLDGSARRRRRRPTNPITEDEDGDYGSSHRRSDGTGAAPRAKRMRPSIGPDADGKDANSVDDVEEEADEAYSVMEEGAAEDAGEGSSDYPEQLPFQPGAIVRVYLENFITYARAEFRPGPSLNMVIGPNGTGKSSLVCAICLGLGYHSNVLGRASAFGDFVQHGRSNALVEIELQRRPGRDRRNIVVRLRISREDNSRRFWLNGRETSLRKIQALMQELRIQVDNLCQFLPQDRVAEFAGLNAVDLLTKTLEAAAPADMKADQATLRQLYREQQEAAQQIRVDTERLHTLEGRHNAQQADVERFHEREDIQRTIYDLETCRPLVRFYEARSKHAALAAQRKAAATELRALQDSLGPTLQAVNRKQAYKTRLEEGLANRTAVLRHAEGRVLRALAAVEQVVDEHRRANDQFEQQSDSIKKKKKEIAARRQIITTLEAKFKNKPRDFVAADWNMKIREKEHQQRELRAEHREVLAGLNPIRGQFNRLTEQKTELERNIAVLDSRRGQQASLLRRVAPEVARGWQWLEENRHLFEKEIFGPPIVTCSIKDHRYSSLVQALLQNDDFLCFTTQSVKDHRTLSTQFYEVMGLSVTIRTCTVPLDSFQPILQPDELAALGFGGVAIDFLDGPAPVLAMLCAERRLHVSPVSLEKPQQAQYDRIVANDRISTWAAHDQMYRVSRRREYGAHAVSTSVRDVRPGRFWTEQQNPDLSEKTELQRKLNEINESMQEYQENARQVRRQAAGLEDQEKEIAGDIERLQKEKGQLQTEYVRWQGLPEKIEMENNTLNRLREEQTALAEARRDQQSTLDELVLKKARRVLQHAEALAGVKTAYQALVDVQVRVVEAQSDFIGLHDKNKHLADLVGEKQEALQELVAAMRAQRKEGKDALAAAEAAAEAADNDSSGQRLSSEELHAMARNKTMEELDNELAAEQTKLELTREVDPSVLEAFRQRGQDIEQLRMQLAALARGAEDGAAQAAAVRMRWEPRVDALIGQINDAFSYNFEQISCAGEVSVHKDEDFDKWAIEIRVKFRESEELQRLDQHRQSGGERAVSTIFYLMALQGMAQAPFRVVDEINQGMDPRNERMVHERMVEIACHEHTSQYFLITPKLLPELRYDENMTVLCIASGRYMPDGDVRLDFRKCIEIQRRLTAAAEAAAAAATVAAA